MKKKNKFIPLSAAIVLTLAGCSASAAQAANQPQAVPSLTAAPEKAVVVENALWNAIKVHEAAQTILEKQALRTKKMIDNDRKILAAVKKVKKYAGKTWYVFSGSTPSGWDCSGLVRWTYQQLGVTLEHRASVQARTGTRVTAKEALPGDVVAFYYPGSSSAYHVGIYLGNGKMIDAPRKGTLTTIEPVNAMRLGNSKVKYIRILPRLQQPTKTT